LICHSQLMAASGPKHRRCLLQDSSAVFLFWLNVLLSPTMPWKESAPSPVCSPVAASQSRLIKTSAFHLQDIPCWEKKPTKKSTLQNVRGHPWAQKALYTLNNKWPISHSNPKDRKIEPITARILLLQPVKMVIAFFLCYSKQKPVFRVKKKNHKEFHNNWESFHVPSERLSWKRLKKNIKKDIRTVPRSFISIYST